jgi:hypothetical protein
MNKSTKKFRFCEANVVNSLTVIHYGQKQYHPHLLKSVKNNSWVKPRGGLWTSPINSNWGWKDWCNSESFRLCDDKNSFKLKFKTNTKILVIDSLADLINLPKINVNYSISLKKEYPDFELLSTVCDAIWLTEKGMTETHLSYPLSLYGWDCESVLIINKDCCYQT